MGKYLFSSINSEMLSLLPVLTVAILTCSFFSLIKKSLAWQTTIPLFFFLAVRSSMPDFYQKMKNILRTEAQGADTVVWLAVSSEATKLPSGLFFQGRPAVCYTG